MKSNPVKTQILSREMHYRFQKIPVGTMVHNIELTPGKGGQMVRAAGASAQLMARENGFATLRLPSGEMRMVHENCRSHNRPSWQYRT